MPNRRIAVHTVFLPGATAEDVRRKITQGARLGWLYACKVESANGVTLTFYRPN